MTWLDRDGWRRVASIAALMSAFALAPAALAAPASRPLSPLSSVPTELSKITLDEESVDGPALWSQAAATPGVGSPSAGSPNAILAWTGTDPAHHLNIMTSQDGLNYTNKLTLDETSPTRPSVLAVNGATVVIAWIGTDPNHSLNVMWDAYGSKRKLTLQEYSNVSPGIAVYNGQIWLTWTGTDPNQSLNVMALGAQGLTPGAKTVLSAYSSQAAPALAADSANHQLLLTWTDTGKSSYLPNDLPYINFLASSDGANWHTVLPAPPPQISVAGPDIMALNPPPANSPDYFWSWAGTDSLHSVNLAYTDTVQNWYPPIVTLDEQCQGGPVLGYVPGASGANQIIMAWTGIDPDHHINIATIGI